MRVLTTVAKKAVKKVERSVARMVEKKAAWRAGRTAEHLAA